MLEGAGMGGVYLANKSVLSMYGGGRTTGICVDSGEDMTYIVPCWEGTPLPNATLILKLGGKHVTGTNFYHTYSNCPSIIKIFYLVSKIKSHIKIL